MVRAEDRFIQGGWEYDKLFPKAQGKTRTVRKAATLNDTLGLLSRIVQEKGAQAKEIAKKLSGATVLETARNLWNFCTRFVRYKEDQEGIEQVRDTARLWADRSTGVDCDCFTQFISAVLTCLRIGHALRITKYPDYTRPWLSDDEIQYSHIYVVIPQRKGEIIIDPVYHEFNREAPYITKKDIPMELQYLSGIPDEEPFNMDIEDLSGGVGDLGLFKRKNKAGEKREDKQGSGVLHTVNRFNPAVAAMRAGVLAAMKLNLYGIAKKLRWAYLSEAEARKRGFEMERWTKYVKALHKLEKTFFSAGGKPENLKKAILEGKGNKDRAMPLKGFTLGYGEFQAHSSLVEILGPEIYSSEVVRPSVQSGVSGLGEVATAAALGVASTLLTALALLLKSIGELKHGPSPETAADPNSPDENLPANMQLPAAQDMELAPAALPSTQLQPEELVMMQQQANYRTPGEAMPAPTPGVDENQPTESKGFMGWVKDNPLLAAGIGVTLVGGGALLISSLTRKKKKSDAAMNGIPGGKRKSGKKRKKKSKARKQRKQKAKAKSKKKTPASCKPRKHTRRRARKSPFKFMRVELRD